MPAADWIRTRQGWECEWLLGTWGCMFLHTNTSLSSSRYAKWRESAKRWKLANRRRYLYGYTPPVASRGSSRLGLSGATFGQVIPAITPLLDNPRQQRLQHPQPQPEESTKKQYGERAGLAGRQCPASQQMLAFALRGSRQRWLGRHGSTPGLFLCGPWRFGTASQRYPVGIGQWRVGYLYATVYLPSCLACFDDAGGLLTKTW